MCAFPLKGARGVRSEFHFRRLSFLHFSAHAQILNDQAVAHVLRLNHQRHRFTLLYGDFIRFKRKSLRSDGNGPRTSVARRQRRYGNSAEQQQFSVDSNFHNQAFPQLEWVYESRSKIFQDQLFILCAQHGAHAHVLQHGLHFTWRKGIRRIVAPAAILLESFFSFSRVSGFLLATECCPGAGDCGTARLSANKPAEKFPRAW